MDSGNKKRHLAKSFSWRIVGSLDSFLFTWFISGDIQTGINLSSITFFTKLVWYYLHEQLWFNSSIRNATRRHIFKTFTWRIVGTADTMLFGFILLGNPLLGIKIGVVETVSKLILYFIHERVWYKINFGLNRHV